VERLLEDFDKAEAEAFDALFARVGELESRRGQEGERTKDALQRQLQGIRRRLSSAAEDYTRRSEAFHKQLLEGTASPEEFRARLVMLEMEYSSRLRIAEEGLQLIGTRLVEHAEDNEGWFRGLLGEVRQALQARLRPVREELEQALRERERSLEERRAALDELRAKTAAPVPEPEVIPEAAPSPETEIQLPQPDPAAHAPHAHPESAQDGGASAPAAPPAQTEAVSTRTQALAEEADRLRAELTHLRAGLEGQLKTIITGLCTEREALRKKLLDLQRDLEAKQAASVKAEEDLAGSRRTVMELRRELKELDEERHQVRLGASESQREIQRLVAERNQLKARVHEVRSGHNAIRKSVTDMAGALKKLLAERAVLSERLSDAERDLKAARAGADPDAPEESRVSIRELEAENSRLRGEAVAAKAEQEALELTLHSCEAERDRVQAQVARAAEEIERTKASAKAVQRKLLDADVTRDRSLADTQAQWSLQKEAFEDALAQKESELTMLRNSLEAAERQWEETLTRQDASRMSEIFKLRSDLEALQWKLQEKMRGSS